ncbi:MAG TPA: apolipoprotein N-acyltransferase [Candidatus Corynebacterium faecigallinarum]|uniref:Apolipoprotein N-acyltransferase n=1 Tax=Candidatus Corynebacterium faecigallinarum TaxID=2838528 RepID=A0A9D2QEE4_9CORY|nr:apolipoprotein N-acyltransferase [Candidatus Corynebacterium faecigallinarum]
MIRFLLLTAASFAAGVGLFASYQPTGLWWAAPLGFAVYFLAIHHALTNAGSSTKGVWGWSLWLSWVQAMACYLFLLPWVGEEVGAIAWIGLSLLESLFGLLFGAGLALLALWSRRRSRAASNPTTLAGSLPTAILLIGVPAWFVATEWLRSNWPFGGFGWSRVAWGQLTGPMENWVAVAGPALVTFMVVLSGVAVALLVARRWITTAGTLAVTLGGGLVLGAVPTSWGGTTSESASDDTVSIAAVQGNVPRLGLGFNEQRRAVLQNHLDATHRLAEEVDSGDRERPDLVIWPENASDINPLTDTDAYEDISEAAAAVGVPLLVGTITSDEVGARNTFIVWDPETGPGEEHIKKFLQPFGEYMPMRDFLRNFSPYVDQAGNFKPGDGPGVVEANGITVGVATCYEVSFDAAYRDAVNNGATVFASPTNNATFGFTDMTYQQLAMNRMRALEYDRSVVVAATSGVSAIVDPNGDVVDRTEIFRAGLLQEDIELRDTETMSARIGPVGEWLLALLGTGIVLFAGTRALVDTKNSRKNRKKR